MSYTIRISVLILFFIFLAKFLSSCKPESTLPIVTTSSVTNITETNATTGGNVTSDGNAEVKSKGVCWSTSENPTLADNKTLDGLGTGSFVSKLYQLTPGTSYFVRAYATNSEGTAYGNEINFSTHAYLPTLTTNTITQLTHNSAKSGGYITSDGGSAVTDRGVCWSKSQSPTIMDDKTTNGNGTGSFTSDLTGLDAGTVYYVRAYATNIEGTAYGNQQSAMTKLNLNIVFNSELTYGQLTDIDNNTYKTIQIGTQTWMAENLKTTRYNDGSDIPHVTDSLEWLNLASPGYCWYKNDESTYEDVYGALYNWYCINTDKLCPAGWHVPTDPEWTALENYLQNNGYNYDGILDSDNNRNTNNKTAKALASTNGWYMVSGTSGFDGVIGRTDYPDKRNASGFTAIAASHRDNYARFLSNGYNAGFWCATETGPGTAYIRNMSWNQVDVIRYSAVDKKQGFSIRCVKD